MAGLLSRMASSVAISFTTSKHWLWRCLTVLLSCDLHCSWLLCSWMLCRFIKEPQMIMPKQHLS